jgi:hypothetical protein
LTPHESSTGGRRYVGRMVTQEVPTVSFQVKEHRQPPVRLVARRRDETYVRGNHALVSGIEVTDAQEQPNAARELLPDDAGLVIAVSARKENSGLPSAGSNDDPAFWAAIVGERRRVFHQLKLKHIHEKADGGMVVPY